MKKIVLIGMPNTGKSTLLNRLTGAHAKVGNWPGLTVSLLSARLLVGDQMAQLIDLPGIYDLSGYSEDEGVVTTYLETQKPDLILFMMNASQVDRQLTLLSQVTSQGIPVVMVMNMADEASAMGITIKADVLRQTLGIPVCLLSAKYGQGTEQLQKFMREGLKAEPAKALSPLEVEAAFTSGVMVPAQASHQLTERIDKVLLHPWLGLPIFFAVMLLLFEGVFAIGKPLQDGMTWLLAIFRTEALEPLLSGLPSMVQGLLLDGLYNGIGTVASFVPLIILFFFVSGHGGGHRLFVARCLSDGCLDVQVWFRWPELCDVVDGLWVQRTGSSGDSSDSLQRPTLSHHADHPIFIVFSALAGVCVVHRRHVHNTTSALGLVLFVCGQHLDGHAHFGVV